MEEYELSDISKDLLIINKTTIERLFESDNLNSLILYMFYYKTAKWQNTTTIKANDEYCKKCLHWGTDKLKLAKKQLIAMNLIEVENKRDEKNQIIGWYVKINYCNNSTIPISTMPENPQVGKQEINAYNNNINANNNTNKKNISKDISKEKKSYGELQNVKLTDDEYSKLKELGLLHYIDTLSFYIKSKGDKYNDHYATIRAWDRKDKSNKGEQKNKREQIIYYPA